MKLSDRISRTGIISTAISSATNLANGYRYVCNTTTAGFSVTLPPTPLIGDYIELVDAAGTWNTNNLTLLRNGNLINALSQDLVCNAQTFKKTSVAFRF